MPFSKQLHVVHVCVYWCLPSECKGVKINVEQCGITELSRCLFL